MHRFLPDPSLQVGVGLLLLGLSAPAPAAAPPEEVLGILEANCFSCHEEGTEKGEIRLDNLGDLSLDARLDLLNKMHEQLHFEEMPPKKNKKQPTDRGPGLLLERGRGKGQICA